MTTHAKPTAPSAFVPLRVVALVNNPCTADARVIREAETLAAAGHVIQVLAHWTRDAPETETIRNVEYRRVGLRFFRKAKPTTSAVNDSDSSQAQPPRSQKLGLFRFFWGKLKPLVEFAISVTVTKIAVQTWIYAFYYTRPGAQHRPDVVHAHDLNTLLAGYRIKRKTGAKLVYDSHELEVGRNGRYTVWEKFVRAKAEDFLIRRADAVITVSDSIADFLQQRYAIERPLVIHNSPEIAPRSDDIPHLRAELGFSKQTPVAVYVGKVTTNRGLEQSTEALVHTPATHLVCVGPRVEAVADAMRAIAQRKGVADRLHFVDPLPHAQVTSFIRTADVSLALIQDVCLSYRFCFPNKLLESMLAGIPVVVADLVELRRLVSKMGGGLITDETRPDKIAEAIDEIVDRRNDFILSKKMRQQLIDGYGADVQKSKLLSLYERLAQDVVHSSSVED